MAQKQEIFTLIDGRVTMKRGPYAPTSDAVWLAAAAANLGAKTVLDVGTGTGAVALCLMAHDAAVRVTGIDVSDEMLATAGQCAELNGRDIELIRADIMTWRTPRTFDLVVTNPPYFNGTPAKHNAHHNADIKTWTRRCVARVRPRGHICIIVDTAAMADVVGELNTHCGDIEIFPLTGAGTDAERVIVRARLGSRGGARLHPALSMSMGAVLRDGLTIDLALATLHRQ